MTCESPEQVIRYGVNMSKCEKNGNCENCNCKESHSIGETRYAFFEGLEKYMQTSGKDPKIVGTGYTLSLNGPSTDDGYKVVFRTGITSFDFFNLFGEYFNGADLQIDVVYDEEELD